MRYLSFLLLSLLFIPLETIRGQEVNIPPTTAEERSQSIEQRHQMRSQSIFREYPVRNVGPVVMSGRVTDIAVYEDNPRHFFVAYASGGVFESTNSGNTMSPVFDHQGTLTIGDIAISKADPDLLWVGTGENNSSRSSYAGTGIYKSSDGGESWEFSGLRGSQHTGRIITHPDDPEVAWVASQGPLYSMNDVRGVYKTTDGGESWQRTLTPADSTGVIDLVIHPENPDILWASTWQRFRQAWNFQEGGEGSAIWKSTDGGETWQRAMEGFPSGSHVGRIGLDVSQSNPDILYAFLDNQMESRTKEDRDPDQLYQEDFVDMSEEKFLALDNEKLNNYLRRNGFPQQHTAESVKEDVRSGEYEPRALSDYLGDANEALFDTEITGAEVYKSTDGGESWNKTQNYELPGLINTYGYYFGEVRVSPTDPDVVYILGVPILKSTDGGETWFEIAENQPVHVDHHAMWINPNDSQHLFLGNDGGLYESHDGGINFIHHNVVPVGQFYSVEVDMEEPYNIYGGLQDNGVYYGSSQGSPDDTQYWESLFGGDGMHVAVDPRNSDRVYTGFQFGNYFRIEQGEDGQTGNITPSHELGEDRYRYNWNTPIEMSNHNPDIIYFGSQKVNRSFDRGETWETLSPDLTHDLPSGNVPYSTMTTISESPVNFEVVWAGTDDGNVQVTRDGGESWELVSEDLPQRRWVSQVHASEHDAATAYISLNGYRYDEFETYIYKTDDYGQTWTDISGNLPEDVVNVIVQDPEKPEILYAGLDHGTFVSFNDGGRWHLLNGVPNVASYDMLVHPRDLDLVVGTHGRSIYVSDVEPIHTVSEHLDDPIFVFEPESIDHDDDWGEQDVGYEEPDIPSVDWMYWIGDEGVENGEVTITVADSSGNAVAELSDTAHHGFNIFTWNLQTGEDEYISPGTYTLTYEINGETDERTLEVSADNNGPGNFGQLMFGSPDEIDYEQYEEY